MFINDFPYEYRRSGIEWGLSNRVVYHKEQLDTISSSITLDRDQLIGQLERQPSYEIESILLAQEAQAIFSFGNGIMQPTLHYEALSDYLRFWFLEHPDEPFYFRRDLEQNQLTRHFLFYWKVGINAEKKQVYYRVQESLEFRPKTMITKHLAYDRFLKSGDTLQIIDGFISYEKK